jgi:hypothetical protein
LNLPRCINTGFFFLNPSWEEENVVRSAKQSTLYTATSTINRKPDVFAGCARRKAKEAANDAKQALIMSLIGIVCFGLILGVLAFRKANSAIQTIDLYQVAQDKRGMATVAKVLGVIDVIGWVVMIISRFALA